MEKNKTNVEEYKKIINYWNEYDPFYFMFYMHADVLCNG